MSSNKRRRLQTYSRRQRPQQSRLREVHSLDMFFPNTSEIDFNPPPVPPKSSQQQQPRNRNEAIAMAMASQASDEDIAMVEAVTACERSIAVRYLKVKNNNVEAAINSIMDGEDISKDERASGWDDSMFSQDRDGNDSGERNLRPLGVSAAPTRGPSPAGSARAPANKSEEDAELAQALALSQQESGFLPPRQETGIVGADGTSRSFVGPLASEKQYKENEWALVRTSHGSSEVVPDVEVEARVNKEGEPRFLKHLPNGDYLPNFLTICHAIPAAREALLLRQYLMHYYGDSDDWWRGNGIALPRIVHTESGTPVDSDIDRYDDFIAETQRLMAFLDGSKRSYASVDGLAKTEMLRTSSQARPKLVERFIDQFTEAAEARARLRGETMRLFSTNVGTTHPDGVSTPYMTVVDMTVDSTENGPKTTLTGLLDNLLWDTEGDSVAQTDNYIQQAAEVVVMRVKQRSASAERLRVEVPATLYLDKYLESNVEISRGIRVQIAEQKQRVKKLEAIESKLKNWKHPSKNEQIQSKSLLEHTLGHFSGKADGYTTVQTEGINGTAGNRSHNNDIAQKLESIIASVDQKLAKLSQQKDKILDTISALSSSTPPELAARGALTEHYTLMGVATNPHITYVLRESDDSDDEADSHDAIMADNTQAAHHTEDVEDSDTTPDGMQWWRIEYTTPASGPAIIKTKVPDYDVLRAAELEHSSTLLVYASDRAADIANFNPSLPEPLRLFLETDNEHFAQERRDALASAAPPAYNFDGAEDGVPRESIEREGRRSFDSMDAQGSFAGGDSPPPLVGGPEYDDEVAFGQHPDFGLGPSFETKRDEEEEVAEIRLSPPVEERDGEMEMLEDVGAQKSVFAKVGKIGEGKGSDARMGEAGSRE